MIGLARTKALPSSSMIHHRETKLDTGRETGLVEHRQPKPHLKLEEYPLGVWHCLKLKGITLLDPEGEVVSQ